MLLKTLPKTFKSSGFRLSLWYSAFFITSSALLLIAAYFFLSSTLKAQDWDAILSELNELVSEYEKGGTTLVKSVVVNTTSYTEKTLSLSALPKTQTGPFIFFLPIYGMILT